MRELHDLLNKEGLAYTEPLPYMPHVTVAKLDNNDQAREVLATSKTRWANYDGSHRISVNHMTFVRGNAHTWTDLAGIELAAPRG
jgi:2'-5' RNA ligase